MGITSALRLLDYTTGLSTNSSVFKGFTSNGSLAKSITRGFSNKGGLTFAIISRSLLDQNDWLHDVKLTVLPTAGTHCSLPQVEDNVVNSMLLTSNCTNLKRKKQDQGLL